MAQTLLKVDNINVFYGNIHAVKDVSFEVNEGDRKSTRLNSSHPSSSRMPSSA